MKRIFALLAFVIIIALLPSGINAAETTVTKNGITVTLLNNTNFCETDCYSVYNICIDTKLSGYIPAGVAISFKDSNGEKITEYGSKVKSATVTVDKSDTKYTATMLCKKVTVAGKKGAFENVDNIPCFDAICFDEFAWWNTSCLNRWPITSAIQNANEKQVLNNSYLWYGNQIWFNNASEMYVYNCTTYFAIANSTDVLNYQNISSIGFVGNNPTSVFENLTYEFEGTNGIVIDSFGVYNGTAVGGANYTSGVFGNAFNFNGTASNKITTNFIVTSGTTNNINFSFSLWYKVASNPTNYATLFGDGGNWLKTSHKLQSYTNYFYFYYHNVSTNLALDPIGAGTFNGVWHHLAIVYNGTGLTGYIDGSLVKMKNGTIIPTVTSNPMVLGYQPLDEVGVSWKGQLDDYRYYNRALSLSEVQDINRSRYGLNSVGIIENLTVVSFTFNIKDSFTSDDLQGVTLSCANAGQPSDNFSASVNSPYSKNFINITTYNCNVSKNGYENFSFSVNVASVSSVTVYLDRVGGLTSTEQETLSKIYFLQSASALPDELIIQSQSCLDENTLTTYYNPVYCQTPERCENVTTACQWGCDIINMQCRATPIETGALFVCFILYMVAILVVPILVLTHHTTKKKRDAIFGFLTIFVSFVIYTITTFYIIPAIASNFGSDYYFTTILVGITIILFPLIDLLLLFNNFLKDRY